MGVLPDFVETLKGKGGDERGVAKRAVVVALRFYQHFISPLFPGQCRFRPTCSEYAVRAVNKYGVLRGGLLAVRRVLRCHPFGPSGYDPVP